MGEKEKENKEGEEERTKKGRSETTFFCLRDSECIGGEGEPHFTVIKYLSSRCVQGLHLMSSKYYRTDDRQSLYLQSVRCIGETDPEMIGKSLEPATPEQLMLQWYGGMNGCPGVRASEHQAPLQWC